MSSAADEKPKRPLNAFFRYRMEHQAEVKKANPEAGLGEITKIISGMWDKEKPDRKTKLEQEFKQDLEKYKKDIEAFNLKHPEAKDEKGGKKKKSSKSKSKEDKKSAEKPAKKKKSSGAASGGCKK